MHCLKLTPHRNRKPWVARITGFDRSFGLAREFVHALVDWSTKVPEYCYFLDQGELYEAMDPGAERYYCRIDRANELVRISIDEVTAALRLLDVERNLKGDA